MWRRMADAARPASSLFITFEGPDGSGKSTQVELLARHRELWPLEVVREPGSTTLGERVRELLLHGPPISVEAEMYLFMAARAELLEERIRPALGAGRTVIADRYHDSTLAYQGARGAKTFWPETFPRPDLTVLLLVEGELGRRRLQLAGRQPDRLEGQATDFLAEVVRRYRCLAAAEPARFLVVEGDQPQEQVAEQVWRRVSALLAERR